MQRFKQRKKPILILSVLLILGTIFGTRFFTSASKPQPSTLRETKPLSELSAQLTTSKLGKIQLPTVVVSSQLNGTITNIPFSTGQNVKGGQPLLQLSDKLGLYTAPLEASKLLLDSTQSLYDKTHTDFSTAEKKAELDISELQLQLKQTELDLQEILNQQQTTTPTTTTPTNDPTNSVSP
ncbi:MAG: HlyD family secretion protein [Candidatus Peribacteria bacterium]|jgi:membrane fusion protein (multidrug efflux system)|nr:HlyD family secretion protein [Candidatus Peribacteria bacterium]